MFNPIAEIVIPIEIPTREAKAKTETHPVTAKSERRNCSTKLRFAKTFLCM